MWYADAKSSQRDFESGPWDENPKGATCSDVDREDVSATRSTAHDQVKEADLDSFCFEE